MPPEEREKIEKEILLYVSEIDKTIDKDSVALNNFDALSKMATGGKKPDYSTFSDQDLRSIYDGALRSTGLNTLSDGTSQQSTKQVDPHRNCAMSIAERGVPTSDLSREEMIEALDDLLKEHGYNYDPMTIAVAQGMMINARSAEVDGRLEKAKFNNMNLEEREGNGYEHTEGRKQLRTLKDRAQEFSYKVEDKAARLVQDALHKQLSTAQDLSPGEVAELIKTGKNNLDPSGMGGGNNHLAKMRVQTLDLTGADLTGVDLSESDLTGITITAESLSRAKGIESVKGVSDAMKQDAAKMQPYTLAMDQLKQEQDRLRTNPSRLDKFVALLKHGSKGIDGEIEKLQKKIDATKLAMNDELQGITIQDRQDHVNMMKQGVGGAKRGIEALDNEIGNDNLAQAHPQILKPKPMEQRKEMLDTREALKNEKARLKGEIETNKSAVKVREKLGPKVEAPKKGTGQSVSL